MHLRVSGEDAPCPPLPVFTVASLVSATTLSCSDHWRLSPLVPAEAGDPPLALGSYTHRRLPKAKTLGCPRRMCAHALPGVLV